MTTHVTDRSDRPDQALVLVHWMVLLWLMMLVVGIVTLRMPGSLRDSAPQSFNLALFTAANVSTLTGFAQLNAQPREFHTITQIVFLLQTLSGAMLCLVGGGMLMSRVLDTRHDDRRIAVAGLILITFAALLGAATIAPMERSFLPAAARGIGALANSALLFGPARGPNDVVLLTLLYPLSLVGSLGTLVVLDVWDRLVLRRPMSDHAWHVLRVLGITYVCGVVAMGLLFYFDGMAAQASLLRSNALTLSAHGYGWPASSLTGPAGLNWIVPALMVVGAGTLGTTGGFGFAWIVTLPIQFARRVMKSFLLMCILLLLALVVLSETEPQIKPERLLTLVVSGGMNVGLSHEPVSITGDGLIIVSMLMVAGRLLPFAVLYAMISDRPNPSVSDQPRYRARHIVDN